MKSWKKNISRVALVCLVVCGVCVSTAQAQGSLTVVEGSRMSYGLGTVWVWQNEDGTIGTRGLIPKLLEQERVILAVQGAKKGKGKKPKLSEVGSVSGGVELNGTLNAAMPIHIRLNYNKGDRIQTAPLARSFKIDEELQPGQAVVVTFRLVAQERVEGERKDTQCEYLLSELGLGSGDGCVLAD